MSADHDNSATLSHMGSPVRSGSWIQGMQTLAGRPPAAKSCSATWESLEPTGAAVSGAFMPTKPSAPARARKTTFPVGTTYSGLLPTTAGLTLLIAADGTPRPSLAWRPTGWTHHAGGRHLGRRRNSMPGTARLGEVASLRRICTSGLPGRIPEPIHKSDCPNSGSRPTLVARAPPSRSGCPARRQASEQRRSVPNDNYRKAENATPPWPGNAHGHFAYFGEGTVTKGRRRRNARQEIRACLGR